ncbi:ABC transporter substrate-binding protein [Sporosarcina beigongshangi]|uniref:ABC transporter substrate-binding protein n=1 Tax=Sporosarcina beigongshangi TaxID=2782538 RepID=UPI00193A7A8D|nr:ABC transporter substrate-binding protein [Sporosarcina beigongshangi]
MKKITLSLTSIALILLLCACNQNETKKVSIMLDWYPNAVHSFLYVAEEKGYFEDEGIELDIQFPANPTDPINLAAAGKVTLGITYQPDVIIARSEQDIGVKSIGVLVRSPLNHVAFLKESGIESPKDLEGKNVGYTGIPLNEAMLQTMMNVDGADYSKVNMVDVGFELNSSLIAKKADAVIGAYINHEVPLLEYEGFPTGYIDPTDFGVPSFYELVIVTSDDTWKKEQQNIEAFWRAVGKAFIDMENDPEEALSILLKHQDEANFPLVEEVERKSLSVLLPKMKSPSAFGEQDEEIWKVTAEWMKATGLLEKEANLEGIYVNMK